MPCELCTIIIDEPGRILYEDALAFTAVNIEPIKSGHVMILPKRHVENLADLFPEEATAFLRCIDRAMTALAGLYDETPICFVNGWKHRTLPHLHAHVLPSRSNLRGLFSAAEGSPSRTRMDSVALAAMAEHLRPAFMAGSPVHVGGEAIA